MIKKIVIGVLLTSVVAGCASTQKLTPEIAGEIQDGAIAAAFYVEGKKIVYDELVYKVLWNENRSQESVFEGSWDVDHEVTATFSESLGDAGLTARSVSSVLSDKAAYKDFEQAILNTRGADRMNVPMSLNDSLRSEFLDAGVDYVMLLRAAHYSVQKVSGFSPQFGLPTLLIVYDVRRNEQVYKGAFPLGGKIAVEESPREVEANGLAKLKSATHEWVAAATTSRLPEALGLTP